MQFQVSLPGFPEFQDGLLTYVTGTMQIFHRFPCAVSPNFVRLPFLSPGEAAI